MSVRPPVPLVPGGARCGVGPGPGEVRALGRRDVRGRPGAPLPRASEITASGRADQAFRSLGPAVLAYVRGQGADDPEDLLGEVFFQVARSIATFEGDDAALRRWVFTLARNRVVDDRRRRARRPRLAAAQIPDAAVVGGEAGPSDPDPDLTAALARLTVDQREVIGLRFVADLSLEDVAELTGRPVGAVKSMQHRALANLERALEPRRRELRP